MKMKVHTFYGVFLLCFGSLCVSGAPGENLTLQAVQVLFMHGIQTPFEWEAMYMGVRVPLFYGDEKFAAITEEGKNQSINFGRKLREKYGEFLGSYQPEKVYALSTDNNRTMTALNLVLQGLYPPSIHFQSFVSENNTIRETFTNHCNWTSAIRFPQWDVLFDPQMHLEFYELLSNETNDSEYYQNRLADHEELFDFANKTWDMPLKLNVKDFSRMAYNMINIHKILNLTLPSWYSDDVFESTKKLRELSLDSMSMSQKLRKMNGGAMAKMFLDNFNKKNDSTDAKKIYLFSGYDTTLVAFFQNHEIEGFKFPPFGSAVIMEKYGDDKNLEYVRVLVWDGKSFSVSKMSNCAEFCPMDKYKEIVQYVIPNEEELRVFDKPSF